MKKALPYLLLQLIVLFYSIVGICSKTAAGKEFLSPEWILLYGAIILILGIYALFWQQILKKIPLNIAYACKSVTVVWGILWGVLFFNETLSVKQIIGTAVVLGGVVLMVTGSEKEKTNE